LIPIGLGVCGRFGIGVREGRLDCRRSLGLPTERPTLLVVAETLWADEVVAWLEATAGLAEPITVLVDAPGDRLLLAQARQTFDELGLEGRVFGRVDEAGLYWGSADRVVCRALDGLVTRALAFRIPVWAMPPADDRQRGILAGLEHLGAGSVVDGPEALAAALARPGWDAPLDASRVETMAGAAIPKRIADAITQMATER
jgi:UDP-N-acetylglucosamine:LPS N-acetylglucosamine transferase